MKNKRYLISLIIIFVMVGVAELTGEREIIFPEISALLVGACVLEKQPWKVTKVELVALMSVASIVGICIVRYVHIPITFQILIGLLFAGITLKLTQTTLVPIISACVLPIVLGTDTWVYPISVIALSSVIVIAQYMIQRFGLVELEETVKEEIEDKVKNKLQNNSINKKDEMIKLIKLLIIIMILAIIANEFNKVFLIAPPLIVAFVELANPNCKLRNKPKEVLLLLCAAAFLGTAIRVVFSIYFGLPLGVSAVLVSVVMFGMFEMLDIAFPPVAAIALLPMLLDEKLLMQFPLQAIIGSFILVTVAMIVFKENSIPEQQGEKI